MCFKKLDNPTPLFLCFIVSSGKTPLCWVEVHCHWTVGQGLEWSHGHTKFIRLFQVTQEVRDWFRGMKVMDLNCELMTSAVGNVRISVWHWWSVFLRMIPFSIFWLDVDIFLFVWCVHIMARQRQMWSQCLKIKLSVHVEHFKTGTMTNDDPNLLQTLCDLNWGRLCVLGWWHLIDDSKAACLKVTAVLGTGMYMNVCVWDKDTESFGFWAQEAGSE